MYRRTPLTLNLFLYYLFHIPFPYPQVLSRLCGCCASVFPTIHIQYCNYPMSIFLKNHAKNKLFYTWDKMWGIWLEVTFFKIIVYLLLNFLSRFPRFSSGSCETRRHNSAFSALIVMFDIPNSCLL